MHGVANRAVKSFVLEVFFLNVRVFTTLAAFILKSKLRAIRERISVVLDLLSVIYVLFVFVQLNIHLRIWYVLGGVVWTLGRNCSPYTNDRLSNVWP